MMKKIVGVLVVLTAIFSIFTKLNAKNWYDGIYLGGALGYIGNSSNISEKSAAYSHSFSGYALDAVLGYSLKYLDTELKLGYKDAPMEVKSSTNYVHPVLDKYNEKTLYTSIVLKPSYTTSEGTHKLGLVFEVGYMVWEDNVSLYKRELENIIYRAGVTYSYIINENHSIYTDLLPLAENTDSVYNIGYKYTFR